MRTLEDRCWEYRLRRGFVNRRHWKQFVRDQRVALRVYEAMVADFVAWIGGDE